MLILSSAFIILFAQLTKWNSISVINTAQQYTLPYSYTPSGQKDPSPFTSKLKQINSLSSSLMLSLNVSRQVKNTITPK